ncbi:MAG: glycosyltransferase family 39 protein [Candidatus Delongbacteria bacterium]|nr:glycosyltransferase family 39 protein [Candidatus Delongbacteria bacterium]
MDVDVIRYATEYAETGSYGSELKLSSGIAYSPKTKLFYPLEGIGIVFPLTVFVHLSNALSPDSQFILYTFNQVFSAIAVFLIFLTLSLFMSYKKAVFYTAVFGLGTPIFVHSKYFLPEPLTLLAITASIYFLLKFWKEKRSLFIFMSGLFSGYTLLTRPDAPIFAGFFSILAIYYAYKVNKSLLIKNTVFYILGFSIFLSVFLTTNYQRFGSILETGYTLDRNEVISSLEKDMQTAYTKAAALYENDQTSKETAMAVQQFQSRQKFLEEMKKVSKEYGDENTAFYTNGALNYLHGLYLILFSPNRSIFFLSPFLILLLFSLTGFYKKYKVEFLIFGLIITCYITLYALRAPLSYAGSAAWGVRYLLPVYPILFLSVIFFDRSEFSKKKVVKKVFYALCAISILFQIIGSSVNYQSVQMPVEYKSKQIYGDKDMTWAHKSRESMMTDFSSSLLLNNTRIALGVLTPEQTEYGVETGPNDWFFYQVIKGKGRLIEGKENLTGNFKLILFLIILSAGASGYYLYTSFYKKEAGK